MSNQILGYLVSLVMTMAPAGQVATEATKPVTAAAEVVATYEPNDQKSQAIEIAGKVATELTSDTDVDFFTVQAPANKVTQIRTSNTVIFTATAGNTDIRVFNSGEAQMATFASTKATAITIKIAGTKQNYTIEVETKTENTLAVNKIMQEQSQWCWAATSEIVTTAMSNYGYTTKKVTQAEVVNAIHKNTNNVPAQNITETASAINYCITASGEVAKGYKGTMSKEEIMKNIAVENEPVVMRVGNGESNGHFVVITGFEMQGSEMVLTIQDPLEKKVIKTTYTAATTTGYKAGDNRVWNYTVEIK